MEKVRRSIQTQLHLMISKICLGAMLWCGHRRLGIGQESWGFLMEL